MGRRTSKAEMVSVGIGAPKFSLLLPLPTPFLCAHLPGAGSASPLSSCPQLALASVLYLVAAVPGVELKAQQVWAASHRCREMVPCEARSPNSVSRTLNGRQSPSQGWVPCCLAQHRIPDVRWGPATSEGLLEVDICWMIVRIGQGKPRHQAGPGWLRK